MKYFTREELEDITTKLIDNPTRETLGQLNEKYNNQEVKLNEAVSMPEVLPNIELTENVPQPSLPQVNLIEVMPNTVPEQPVVVPFTTSTVTGIDSNMVSSNTVVSEVPNFELPQLEVPNFNNPNNEPINFTGDLFQPQSPAVENLMQTTDNFNSVQNTMPSTEVPVTGAPFFGTISNTMNNPIEVGTAANNMPTPTMFGQLEQNYM